MASHGDPTQLTAQLRSQLRDYIGFTGAINSTLKSINQIQSELDDDKKPINLVKARLDKSYDTLEEQANDEMRFVRSTLCFAITRLTLFLASRQTRRRSDYYARRSHGRTDSDGARQHCRIRYVSSSFSVQKLSLINVPCDGNRKHVETTRAEYEETERRPTIDHGFTCSNGSGTPCLSPLLRPIFSTLPRPRSLNLLKTSSLDSSPTTCSDRSCNPDPRDPRRFLTTAGNTQEIDDQGKEGNVTGSTTAETRKGDRCETVEEDSTRRGTWGLDLGEDHLEHSRRQESVSALCLSLILLRDQRHSPESDDCSYAVEDVDYNPNDPTPEGG